MSSYVFMKVLESTPQRYDRGIRLLSRGGIDAVYRRLAEIAARPGARVLDIGCGTGGVSLACAERGAEVVGIDVDPGMIEVARAKPVPRAGRVELLELSAMEIEDRFASETFDAVVSCLAFSELEPDERAYVLREVHRLLRPGGVIAIADEVPPATVVRRLLHGLVRWPLAALTYVLTQTTTRPVAGLERAVGDAGFDDVVFERMPPGDIAVVHAHQGRRG